jgi:hypothetical protein
MLVVATAATAWNCGGRSPIDAYGLLGAGGLGVGGSAGATSGGAGSAGSSGSGGSAGQCLALCDGVCTDTSTDALHCGSCDNRCADGQVCAQGSCATLCFDTCDGQCVDLDVDPNHCGACNVVCNAGEVCSDGLCGSSCSNSLTACSGSCVNLEFDPNHCGGCNVVCAAPALCSVGSCGTTCVGGTLQCGNVCVDPDNDPEHCGNCSTICAEGLVCSLGECSGTCNGGTTLCGESCVDTDLDPDHCGACDQPCAADQVCSGGLCASVCGGDLTKCGNQCVDTEVDPANCGECGETCGSGQDCVDGHCKDCNSALEDCDKDDWLASEGDCCDKPGACGSDPSLVNPGALEVLGNGADDDCNGKIDLFDTEILNQCDDGITSNASDPFDYARALGICRVTEEDPEDASQRTWGLIDAQLLRADGSPLADPGARSVRTEFGNIAATQGEVMAVLSTGIAADATQTNPGPNGGAPDASNVSVGHVPASAVDIEDCDGSYCVEDWFGTANPPLKQANSLPRAPDCGGTSTAYQANDSVMLVLRLRAPTNVRAFSFNSYFLSAEYPEYVCSAFNDQFVALVDTPGGVPAPIPNPIDKNLLVYTQGGSQWPIGINVAKGTSLFAVCAPQEGNPCWNVNINAESCSLGAGNLLGTGFEAPAGADPDCTIGGGTHWLTTAGNVVPGSIVELRIVIWDVGDAGFDSTALIDGFQWLPSATLPGTN